MYSSKTQCPDCERFLNHRVKECSCGWKKEAEERHDPRCSFILNGERCCLPGSICSSTLKSSDWRCSYHHASIGNNFEGARWLAFIKKNLQDIIHFRKHYFSNMKNCARCEKLRAEQTKFCSSSTEKPELSKNTTKISVWAQNQKNVPEAELFAGM